MKIRNFRAKIEIGDPYAVAIVEKGIPFMILTYKSLEEREKARNNFYDIASYFGFETIRVEILNGNWNLEYIILSDLIKN